MRAIRANKTNSGQGEPDTGRGPSGCAGVEGVSGAERRAGEQDVGPEQGERVPSAEQDGQADAEGREHQGEGHAAQPDSGTHRDNSPASAAGEQPE